MFTSVEIAAIVAVAVLVAAAGLFFSRVSNGSDEALRTMKDERESAEAGASASPRPARPPKRRR